MAHTRFLVASGLGSADIKFRPRQVGLTLPRPPRLYPGLYPAPETATSVATQPSSWQMAVGRHIPRWTPEGP